MLNRPTFGGHIIDVQLFFLSHLTGDKQIDYRP